MLELKDLIYIILISILFVLYCKNNREGMTNTAPKSDELRDMIKDKINDIYQADIQAIRNLSTIAEKIQEGGKSGKGLILPTDVIIRGNLTVDKDSEFRGSGFFGEQAAFGVNSGRKLIIQPSNSGSEQTYLSFYDGNKRTGYIIPHRNGKLDLQGNVNIKGPAIVKGNLYAHGESGNVLRANSNIQVESIRTNNIDSSSIKTGQINCQGDIKCDYITSKEGGEFCEASGRPVKIQNNNKYGETSWVSFYRGKERCGYVVGSLSNRSAKLTKEAQS